MTHALLPTTRHCGASVYQSPGQSAPGGHLMARLQAYTVVASAGGVFRGLSDYQYDGPVFLKY